MADLSQNTANVAASSQAIIDSSHNFGATVLQGQVVYRDANGLWQLLNITSATGTGLTGATNVRGMALNSGTNGQPAAVVLTDPGLAIGATLANAVAYYASHNSGNVAPVADIAAGNYPVVLGIAVSTTKLNFNPLAAGITL